jgi:hypothetical protein
MKTLSHAYLHSEYSVLSLESESTSEGLIVMH